MAFLFWASLFVVFFAYLGYGIVLKLAARKRPVLAGALLSGPFQPSVSIVIAARNEAARLPAKLNNLRALHYPQQLVQIIVVSDGSTDETAALLEAQPDVLAIVLPASGGKASALNRAVAQATGEILVFLDARQAIDLHAVASLIAPFADPEVGAVSGELLLEAVDGAASGDALGIYWKIEKALRKLESASGSVVGVTGAIYAMRRELYVPMPPGLILDDVFVPMNVVRQGWRVLFQPAAIARDRIFSEPGKEFGRKVRTLTGNLQLVRAAPWLLTPANPILFRFVSHKMLRLAVPFLLVLMLVSSAFAGGWFYRTVFVAQLLFYVLAGVGMMLPGSRRWRAIAVPSTFTMLNAAAALAFYKFFKGDEVWK